MKKLFLFFLLILRLSAAESQLPPISPLLLNTKWKANWITYSGESPKQSEVYHFRKNFNLKTAPGSFVIHMSADACYQFFVNGQAVSSGSNRSYIGQRNFETVDIASQLKTGKNTLAAMVWNAGEQMALPQIKNQPSLILQGNTKTEDLANTNDTWLVLRNDAYNPLPVEHRNTLVYLRTATGDDVDGSRYPWGWEQPDFDDSKWKNAVQQLSTGKPQDRGCDDNEILVPRTIPLFLEERMDIGKPVATEQSENLIPSDLSDVPFTIKANTKCSMLIDQGTLVNAFPVLNTSGGKSAKITLTYSEALYDKDGRKGNRNEWLGREIRGLQDRFTTDGGADRNFKPLSTRTWRWLQINIETGEESLIINDIYGLSYRYPFKKNASFKSSDSTHAKIWETGWHTSRLCAGESFYSSPYSGQMSDPGDARIQALTSLYISGDDRLMRKSIEEFNNKCLADILAQQRYPLKDMQVSPSNSLFWVSMIFDYWMLRNDTAFIKKFLPSIGSVLAWEERMLDSTTMIRSVENGSFENRAWPQNEEERTVEPPVSGAKGGSSMLTLQFVYTLRQAAALYDYFGKQAEAQHCTTLADKLVKAAYHHCWDKNRQLFADDTAKTKFSQHTNILAVLTDAIPFEEQRELLFKIMGDKSLTQTTLYFRFYLHEALKKHNLGKEFNVQLENWRQMLNLGLTTFAENTDHTGSDCHGSSASPCYHFLSAVLGINPGSPGFETVRIEPVFRGLTFAEGKMQHPKGEISVAMQWDRKGIKVVVSLPEGLDGEIILLNDRRQIKGGMVHEMVF